MADQVVNPYPEHTLRQFAEAGIQADALRKALENARKSVSEMLVTEAPPEPLEEPKRVLLDITKLDGKALIESYIKRHQNFGTVPFDLSGDRLRLYPGGVTIWSGFPGAGKTTLIRQLICHCLHRGSSVFLASLEEDPENVLVNLAAVACGTQMPSAEQMQWFIDLYCERFRLWGQIGIADHQEILGVIRDLADKGIRHAIIDSLMCLDVANDDFEGQRKFANLLAATARVHKIHLHLVAHPRKLVSADQDLDINDVAGAREITGIADNVLFIRRNRQAEADHDPLSPVTPMLIGVKKQRHGTGAVGNIQGWFHREYRQFHTEQNQQMPTRYLPDEAFE